MPDVTGTYGALLVGGIVAAVFSGIVDVQCFAYFKFYPSDHPRIKVLVSAVWLLNFCHTIFVSISLWYYFIIYYGERSKIQDIPWSLALTIAFTAALTFLVHCFYVHRIYKMSQNNRYIASLLGSLAVLRLSSAWLTTAKLIILKNLGTFVRTFRWSFTLGLSLSSILDVLITGLLFYFLMRNRTNSPGMNRVIDTLILYTFENGSLTCAATLLSLTFWLAMPTNYVFLAIHFVISKFYANSLLATLNTRKQLQRGGSMRSLGVRTHDRALPVVLSEDIGPDRRHAFLDRFTFRPTRDQQLKSKASPMHINVEKSICTVEEGPSTASAFDAMPVLEKEQDNNRISGFVEP